MKSLKPLLGAARGQNDRIGDKFLSPGDKLKSPETLTGSGQGTKFLICPLLSLLLSIKKKIIRGVIVPLGGDK